MQWKKRLSTSDLTRKQKQEFINRSFRSTANFLKAKVEEIEVAVENARKAGDDEAVAGLMVLLEKAKAYNE